MTYDFLVWVLYQWAKHESAYSRATSSCLMATFLHWERYLDADLRPMTKVTADNTEWSM